MTMSDALALMLVSIAGLLLGAIFFGGLYLTVRKGISSQSPALWFFGSLVVRMGIALAGFYFVSDGSWQRLMACFLGFVVARLVVTWLTRTAGQQASPATGARHAP
jgi:F1F0 ATPase subunit 2